MVDGLGTASICCNVGRDDGDAKMYVNVLPAAPSLPTTGLTKPSACSQRWDNSYGVIPTAPGLDSDEVWFLVVVVGGQRDRRRRRHGRMFVSLIAMLCLCYGGIGLTPRLPATE